MAESTYNLDVITPEKIVYSKEVTALVAHGTSGHLGVMAHHTPLVTSLCRRTVNVQAVDVI